MKTTSLILKSIALVTALAFLNGCNDVDTPTGEIPAEYMNQAQQIRGVFQGEFHRIPTTLLLDLNGRRPVISVQNDLGNDLINYGCGTIIGQLKNFRAQENQISSATFAFNSKLCGIVGEEITFKFRSSGKIVVELLEGYRWEDSCYPSNYSTSTDRPGMRIPRDASREQDCRQDYRPYYITGTFTRVQ